MGSLEITGLGGLVSGRLGDIEHVRRRQVLLIWTAAVVVALALAAAGAGLWHWQG